jgi:hypothetical protein
MFKSKRRAIVTPQSEHLKLVGTLAMYLYGQVYNPNYAKPHPAQPR